MGTYLNPGNSGFERILKTYYVDKTGMIDIINKRIDTTDSLLCITRPRRFGKSYAAQMLSGVMESSCKTGVPQLNHKGFCWFCWFYSGSAPVLLFSETRRSNREMMLLKNQNTRKKPEKDLQATYHD